MLFSCLCRIGVNQDDLIIIAVDGRNNWRKEVDPEYKANRKDLREQSKDINWDHQFELFDQLLDNLRVSTPFRIIKVNRLEADDVIAVGTRFFEDKDCVILSCDADYEQLASDRVKIFSDRSKRYKEVKNPYKVLAKKLEKEVADNLTSEVLTEEDFKRRETVVSLLTLPDFVEQAALTALNSLTETKDYDIEQLRFGSLKNRFLNIYNSDKIVTYEQSMKKKVKRKRKKT